MRQLKLALLTGIVLLTIALPAFPQSCSLCYTQVASATAKFIEALRSGILVLIIPPFFLSVGITYLAYSKRNQFKRPDNSESDNGW
jgi:hypothetical protein